jgi:hypothetical protein
MALGLNRDDTVIRRRLKQKLEFVAEAAGMATEPTDDDLRAYLAAHPDSYRTDARVSFVHVFLSAERRGDAVAQDALPGVAEVVSVRQGFGAGDGNRTHVIGPAPFAGSVSYRQ